MEVRSVQEQTDQGQDACAATPAEPAGTKTDEGQNSEPALACADPRGVKTLARAVYATPRSLSKVLPAYFLLTYLVLLFNAATYLKHVEFDGLWTSLFAASVYLTYTLVYLLPMIVLVLVVYGVVRWSPLSRLLHAHANRGRWMLLTLTVLGCTFVQCLLFADKTVFGVFGFHLNGFVWNLVCTKGGIESMGGGPSTTILAALVGVVFLLVQTGLMILLVRMHRLRSALDRLCTRRMAAVALSLLLLIATTEQIAYGVSSFRDYGPILAAADTFPFFVRTTFSSLARTMGYKSRRSPVLAVNVKSNRLRYPLEALQRDASVEPLNIVWLVTESLRADMLQPDIMPNAWRLSKQSSRFEHHYSGGNGTRMGMFSMFYGLYGPYWFSFLAQGRGPVLIDTLIDMNYQMSMYTGAKFTYPEFTKTIFARLPLEKLHEGGGKPSWRQDQRHITSMLRFLDQRDPDRPFMTFMFFESPHANYSFSKSSIIRRPYAQELNYVTMDLHRDIGLIKNRYINSCHQMDSQIGRILDYLTAHHLLRSTIVLITGDHGEEFMEKGRWGHNSEFTEEQTLVPLVLWVPDKPARVVKRLTSHLDIPATIMTLLGVTNPPQDYSQGYDLFGSQERPFTVICDWNHVAYVDRDFKAVFPTSAFAILHQQVTTSDDVPVANRAAFNERYQQRIVDLMRGLKTFCK